MTDAEIAAQLAVWLGPTAVSHLTTPAHRYTAHRVIRLIADTAGAGVGCAWMVGQNPHLADDNPLLAIAGGRGGAVLRAARAYLNGAPA